MKLNKNKLLIFLVDDDAIYLQILASKIKENCNCEIKTFLTGEACLDLLDENPDLVFLDYCLNSQQKNAKNGLQILESIKAKNTRIEVVMLSAQDQLEAAVNCIKFGAFDYIVKSETAFVRAEKAIKDYQKIKLYKNSTVKTIIIVAVIFILSLVFQIWRP
ncbi:MAG: response regulator [Paludibacteraceae bacterium]|nr:response regulator [Paludibacteraceae bacterium]MBN2786712.1 response regulator [Paludibacteraceae bacterium]